MALGWCNTIGGELELLIVLLLGYSIGKGIELLIKFDNQKK